MFLVVYGDSQDVLLLQQDRSSFTTRAIPGDAIVACGDPNDHGIETAPGPSATLRIEDPDGWYRSIEVDHSSSGCAVDAMPSLPGGRGIEVPPSSRLAADPEPRARRQHRARRLARRRGRGPRRPSGSSDRRAPLRGGRHGRLAARLGSPVLRAQARPWLSEVAPEGNPNSAPWAALSPAASPSPSPPRPAVRRPALGAPGGPPPCRACASSRTGTGRRRGPGRRPG